MLPLKKFCFLNCNKADATGFYEKKQTNFDQVRRRFNKRDKFDANVNIGLNHFWGSGLYFWVRACTCRPVYCPFSVLLLVLAHVFGLGLHSSARLQL